ncbi:MAG: hypothetical protein RIC55_06865 [Pirellulaceae bacterium]
MQTLFPFGFPYPTAFYLTLYVLTLVLHVLAMNYVLAGSIYVAVMGLIPRRNQHPNASGASGEREPAPKIEVDPPLTALLREWLPFAVSAAITAGVAPLLFVQIVYQREFYTANLLLSWRWMIVIPTLIVAFYLLYLLKSDTFRRWPYAVRATIGLLTAGCFLFVAFCWTANHLLSIAPDAWPSVYQTRDVTPVLQFVAPRLALWAFGSFAAMAMIAGWQLWGAHRRGVVSQERLAPEVGKLAAAAIGGLVLSVAAGNLVLMVTTKDQRALLFGEFALPYVVVAIAAAAVQAALWGVIGYTRRLSAGVLVSLTVACLTSLIGVAAARESFRLANISDLPRLYAAHAESAEVGGFAAFAVFLVLNTALIGFCLWLVRTQRRKTDAES